MKRVVFVLGILLFLGKEVLAQTPREIKQIDKHRENFWESPTAIAIGITLIVLLIFSRKWSSKILRKRDETIDKEKEEKE